MSGKHLPVIHIFDHKEVHRAHPCRYPREVNLPAYAVLIDILSGVLTRFEEGELILSLFALSRTAAIHGENFSGVQYSFEDLVDMYAVACPDPDAPCGLRVIARIGEDHFVVLLRVTSKEVIYREMSKGVNGEDITLTAAEFVEVWKVSADDGYLIVSDNDLIPEKKLTDEEAMRVRGAFFGLFLVAIFSAILLTAKVIVASIVFVVVQTFTAVVSSIISIVANVGNWIVQGVRMAFSSIAQSGIFQSIKQGFATLGRVLLSPVKFVGRFVQRGFVFLKETFGAGLQRIGSGLMRVKDFVLNGAGDAIFNEGGQVIGHKFTFSQVVARNLVAAGLNIGATKGLESFGLPPSIARIGGAFFGAGFIGVGAQASGFLRSGLQGLLLQGVSEMGLHIDLPPPFVSAISILAGSVLSSYFDPDLTLLDSITDVAPQVSSKLTLGGMDLVGRSMGLDARISRLIGLPISASVGGLLDTLTNPNGGGGPGGIFSVITTALLAEGVHMGTNTVFDELNLSPMLNHFGLTLFSSVSEGLLNAVWNTSGQAGSNENIFSRISGNLAKFGRAVASGVGDVISFGGKIVESGLGLVRESFARAVDFFSELFSRDTQEALLLEGNGSIEEAILNTAVINGNTATAVVGDSEVFWDGDLNQLIVTEGNREKSFFDIAIDGVGQFFSTQVAYAEEIEEGISLRQTFEDNKLTDISIFGAGTTLFRAVANGPLGLVFDTTGNIVTGILEIPQIFKVGVADGAVDFIETEGRDGIFATLLADAAELLAEAPGYIYSAAQKVTLALFDIVKGVLEPIRAGLNILYGATMGINDYDTGTQAETAATYGLPDLEHIGENYIPDGEKTYNGSDFQDFKDKLPLYMQQTLLNPNDPASVQITDYFQDNQKDSVVIFLDNNEMIQVIDVWKDQWLSAQNNVAKQTLLFTGDHNAITPEMVGYTDRDEYFNQQFSLPDSVKPPSGDGGAQTRPGNLHLTDIFQDPNGDGGGFMVVHIDKGANSTLDGFFYHALVEYPPYLIGTLINDGQNNP